MIGLFIGLYSLMAVLFLAVSLLTRPRFWYLTLILNIAFLAAFTFSQVKFVGAPVPTYLDIPFLSMEALNEKNIVNVQAGFITEKYVYMVIKNNDDERFIAVKNTPEFLAGVEKAVAKRKGWDFQMTTDTHYQGMTAANIPMGQFQENENLQPKIRAKEGEVEDRGAATGTGMNSGTPGNKDN